MCLVTSAPQKQQSYGGGRNMKSSKPIINSNKEKGSSRKLHHNKNLNHKSQIPKTRTPSFNNRTRNNAATIISDTDASVKNSRAKTRARIWLCFLIATCCSLYSLHSNFSSIEVSKVQKELEQEQKYLSHLFQKTAHDVLEGIPALKDTLSLSGSSSTSNQLTASDFTAETERSLFSGNHNNLPPPPEAADTYNYGTDFSQLDPKHHHAIVIPYRDRKYHLEKFIEHMGPYLKRNFPKDTFELWIIEQDDSFLFNRAWLANVGIMNIKMQNRQYRYQSLKKTSLTANNNKDNQPILSVPPAPTCIILHDVDLIPSVDGVPYTNCSRPMQLGSELAHFNNSVPYALYAGGVGPSMTMEHWVKINGMSNDYFGWGGEDDDLWHRLRMNFLLKRPVPRPPPPPAPDGTPVKGPKFWPPEIQRPPKGLGKFHPISEAQTVHHNQKYHNQWKRIGYMLELMQNNSKRWKDDGLSDLRMTITGDATTITHIDSIQQSNTTTGPIDTDRTVLATSKSSTTTITRKHFITAKQPGSLISSLSIEPSALASFAAIHHIKAIPKITPLEFIHVTQNDGGLIERAGAAAGISWGACKYHHALEKEMACPDRAMPELEGRAKQRRRYASATPWHSPLQDFEENPYRGRPTFAVVRNPYERLVEFYYCPWNGYKGENPDDPDSLNKFIQHALFPPQPPVKEGETKPPRPPPAAFLHLRPQFHYIFANNHIGKHNQPFVTHILRYENLHQDFDNLMKLYGLDNKVKLPTEKLNPVNPNTRKLSYNDFTDKTLEMIHKFYNPDFVRFGYKRKFVMSRKTRPPTEPPSAAPNDASNNESSGMDLEARQRLFHPDNDSDADTDGENGTEEAGKSNGEGSPDQTLDEHAKALPFANIIGNAEPHR